MIRRGYTLFELVLVMAVMLIVAGLASPLIFEGLHSEGNVTAASDMVRARWADCRSQAIEEGRPYRFAVIPNTGKFKIEPFDAGSPLAGGDASTNPTGSRMADGTGPASGDSSNEGLVIEEALPRGVRFGTKEMPVDPESDEAKDGDYVTIAVFLPNGTAKQDVEITFGAKGTVPVTLRLRGLTGASTQSRPTEDSR